MWTKLPPDFESIDNQSDMYSLVAMHPHLGGRVLTWGRRDLTWGERNLTWGRRVPASALSSWGSMPQLGNTMMRVGRVLYLLAKASSLVKQMPTRGRGC